MAPPNACPPAIVAKAAISTILAFRLPRLSAGFTRTELHPLNDDRFISFD
jgi:hypothetical protein